MVQTAGTCTLAGDLLYITALVQNYYGLITDPSQGLSWSLGAVYIDMPFP